MTPTPVQTSEKLIHIARIYTTAGWQYLFLKKNAEGHFTWHEELNPNEFKETPVSAQTVEEAMRLATRHWKNDSFTHLNCGFRYTLPERDEHGINALYHQMVASYSSSNGIYYDEELGNNCFVQNASDEAVKLSRRLIQEAPKTPK